MDETTKKKENMEYSHNKILFSHHMKKNLLTEIVWMNPEMQEDKQDMGVLAESRMGLKRWSRVQIFSYTSRIHLEGLLYYIVNCS